MGAIRHVLVSCATGEGRPEHELRIAGLVTLLQRRARTPIVLLSPDPARTASAHPDVAVMALDAIATALVNCEFLCVAGELRTAAAIARAARHVLAARLAGVPVALVSVDVGARSASPVNAGPPTLVAEILASVESISALDARSAAHLTPLCGRRVETTAPPEIVLDLPAGETRTACGIDARLLAGLPVDAANALAAALGSRGITDIVVLGTAAPGGAFAASTVVSARDWRTWSRAVGECALVFTNDAAATSSAILACGAVPIVQTIGADAALHRRIGLASCVVDPARSDEAAWSEAIDAGLRTLGQALAGRVAPLRSLAWRALGPLADAARASGWNGASASAGAKTLAAEACALLARPALEAGDATVVEGILEPHRAALATEPAWAEVRARAYALQGGDAEGQAALEAALALHPDCDRVWAALARARLRRGDVDGARAAWQRVAELCTADAEPAAELAALALFGGRVEAALGAWQEAQRRAPGHAASARAVRACLENDARREARFWAELAAERPDVAVYFHAAGLAFERAGAHGDAEAYLVRGTEIAPACSALWDALACSVARRDADGAQHIFARARALEAASTP